MKKIFCIFVLALFLLSAVALAQENTDEIILETQGSEDVNAEPVLLDSDGTEVPEPTLIAADDTAEEETETDNTVDDEEEMMEDEEDTTEEENEAGIAPDSILYGLDLAIERLRLSLTFNKQKKAELHLKYAAERLEEVKAMQKANKDDKAAKAAEKQKKNIEEAEEALNDLEESGENVTDVETKLVAQKAKNVEVLTALLEKVPEQAKESIQKAIEKSQQKRKKERKAQKEKEDKNEEIETEKAESEDTDEEEGIKVQEKEMEKEQNKREETQKVKKEEKERKEKDNDKEDIEDETEDEEDLETEDEKEVEEDNEEAETDEITIATAQTSGEKYKCKTKIGERIVIFYIKGESAKVEKLGSPKEFYIFKEGEAYHWLTNTGHKAKQTDLPTDEIESLQEMIAAATNVECSKYAFSENLILNPPAYVKFTGGEDTTETTDDEADANTENEEETTGSEEQQAGQTA